MTGADGGGQGPPSDGSDAEEAERCPICLGVPAEGELAMPDSCCHVFCLGCLLMWAELQVVPSCPVDRRPFRNVHRWDRSLRCVQVPVRRRVAETEADNCGCRDAKNRVPLKSKFQKRSRQQRVQKMDHSKTKGLVRKCNDDDSFSVNRKKIKGADCCPWSSSILLSSTTATQEVQPMLFNKDAFNETKKCKLQVQECPWLSLAAPITANGISRFVPLNDNHRPFTFGLRSSTMTSTPSFGPDHFIFQGVVCAITCPKGGEKRGGRASNTESPSKKAESLPSQRLGRNAKSQRDPPASDPSSSPAPSQSGSASDSDSSSNQQTSKPKSSTSRVPVKRKGKRVTNRKAGGKRKIQRKKPSSEFVDSPSESENEDGDDVDDPDEEEDEEEKEGSNSEAKTSDGASDAEGSLNTDPKDVNSPDDQEEEDFFNNNLERDINDTLVAKKSNEQTERPEPDDDDDSRHSCPSDSPPKSPDDKPLPQEEEPPIWSISTGDHQKMSTSPQSEPDGTSDQLISTEDDNAIESSEKTETGDKHDGKVWRHVPTESNQSPTLSSPCPELSKEKMPDQEAKASERGAASGDVANDHALPKDDVNVLHVDRSSPVSEASAETPTAVGDNEPPKDGGPRDPNHERKNGRQRRSRFHSPTSSWSPKRESGRETSRRSRSRSRSRSRERAGSPPSSRCSRARSRERERQRDSGRRERARRRSGTRSKSRSRSPSRTRSYRRGYSPQRPPSRDRSPRGNERGGARRAEGRRYRGGGGAAARFENGVPAETSPEHKGWSENPDWVTEKTRGESEARNWDSAPRWEDRGPRGRGGYERGRTAGRAGGFRHHQQDDDNNNNNRRPPWNHSGTGNDAYSRFNENRGGARRKPDSDGGDSALDRSGWSSASSWAVRRTLPADVQDYYSKRERGGAGAWNRSEEEQQPPTDAAKSEGTTPTLPGNAPAPVLTTMLPPPPPQLNVLHHHFPPQGPRAPPPTTLQPTAPYAVAPPIPVHLHSAVPPLRAPAQGLPPPPPPPPPMQQGGQMVAATQPDGQTTRMASTAAALGKAVVTPTLSRIGQQAINPATLPSSTTPAQHYKVQADSSKKEKKQQIQEKAIDEVRTAIKPFYQKKEITKEEYKEIVRKAVEKICHSKSGEVNTSKVANLVKAYVDKYKHARKK
ncbi:uncharacterized protein scaf11 isoform X2 [Stigmatopora nigra]